LAQATLAYELYLAVEEYCGNRLASSDSLPATVSAVSSPGSELPRTGEKIGNRRDVPAGASRRSNALSLRALVIASSVLAPASRMAATTGLRAVRTSVANGNV